MGETSHLLPGWSKGNDVTNWAASFVDGLVGCFESGIEGKLEIIPEEGSNQDLDKLFSFVNEIAEKIQENTLLKKALLDVPLRVHQRRIRDLRKDPKQSPAPDIASTLFMDYRSSQHHSDEKTPYRRTLNIVLLSLAIWGSVGDQVSKDASTVWAIDRTDRTLVQWRDQDIMDCFKHLILCANGINSLPQVIRDGLKKYAAFVQLESPITFKDYQLIQVINDQAQSVDGISPESGSLGSMGSQTV